MDTRSFFTEGQYVDIPERKIYPARINVRNGKIFSVEPVNHAPEVFIIPGFVDAHIHIESSMLVPSEFARVAVRHGTVATVDDPHEIANVCGLEGVYYMIENGDSVPFKFNFGAPSCVPATDFETSGAVLGISDMDTLLKRDDILYLTEMMNFPGVLYDNPDVYGKIAVAKKYHKPVDGHAPGLRGDLAEKYARAGISTDHECFTIEEALDKIHAGMKILIREGSAARNFEALIPLMATHPDKIMFCSDDKHPDELLKGHINTLVARSIAYGYDLFDTLYAATIAPVRHYHLPVGTLKPGEPADFIVLQDLRDFHVLKTVINGSIVYDEGKVTFDTVPARVINNFNIDFLRTEEFNLKSKKAGVHETTVNVIEAIDGQLVTNKIQERLIVKENQILPSVEKDVLKIVVINRYRQSQPSVGFIKNTGLQRGAIASTVAHDSHNIVCVGVDDNAICRAVNAVIKEKGGISVFDGDEVFMMPLPVGGLMTTAPCEVAAAQYEALDAKAKELGSKLSAPYMTLSFMALPVIPALKMTDKGLFDVGLFDFIPVEL